MTHPTEAEREAAQTAKEGALELVGEAAEVAAAMYAALLSTPIPQNTQGIESFTSDQAFALVNTLFYEALKDGEIA